MGTTQDWTLYLDESGTVTDAPVSVKTPGLRCVGGVLARGAPTEHEAHRATLNKALAIVPGDWHAKNWGTVNGFARQVASVDPSVSPDWSALRDAVRRCDRDTRGQRLIPSALRRQIGAHIHRATRATGQALMPFLARGGGIVLAVEHDLVGTPQRAASLTAAATLLGAVRIAAVYGGAVRLHLVVEGRSDAAVPPSALLAPLIEARARAGLGSLEPGEWKVVNAKVEGLKRNGPVGLVLSDAAVYFLGPRGEHEFAFDDCSAEQHDLRWFHVRNKASLAVSSPLVVGGAGRVHAVLAEVLAGTITRDAGIAALRKEPLDANEVRAAREGVEALLKEMR